MDDKSEERSGRKKAYIGELARRLHLSPGTVSFVLNGRGDEMRIAAATQKRILDAAAASGFGRMGSCRGTPRIAMFYPVLIRTNLVNLVMNSIHRNVLDENFEIELVPQPFDYGQLEKREYLFRNAYCDGVIIVDLAEEDLVFLMNRNFEIPIALFNHRCSRYSTVCIDNYEVGRRAADIFRMHGKKKMGLIRPCEISGEVSLRSAGFLDACRKNGIAVPDIYQFEMEESAEGGQEAARRILENGILPEALFVQANMSAVGVIDLFRSHGIRIPEQMEIIAFGNPPIAAMAKPSITNICSPVEDMSGTCVKMVLRMIKTGDYTPVSMLFPIQVIYRESCRE